MVKSLFFFLFTILLFSCNSDNLDDNNILPNIPVNETLFLNNPEFINLQVVGGWAYTQGGISGIIVFHSGINTYLAFERSAPHISPKTCSKMTVKNSIVMHCSCDNTEFSLLNGGPLSENVKYSARLYRTVVVGNTLQISNY